MKRNELRRQSVPCESVRVKSVRIGMPRLVHMNRIQERNHHRPLGNEVASQLSITTVSVRDAQRDYCAVPMGLVYTRGEVWHGRYVAQDDSCSAAGDRVDFRAKSFLDD